MVHEIYVWLTIQTGNISKSVIYAARLAVICIYDSCTHACENKKQKKKTKNKKKKKKKKTNKKNNKKKTNKRSSTFGVRLRRQQLP